MYRVLLAISGISDARSLGAAIARLRMANATRFSVRTTVVLFVGLVYRDYLGTFVQYDKPSLPLGRITRAGQLMTSTRSIFVFIYRRVAFTKR